MQLNIEQALADSLGQRGVSRRQLSLIRSTLSRSEEEFTEAITAGVIPFVLNLDEKVTKAEQLRQRWLTLEELWIFGDPGLLNGLKIFASKDLNIHWLSGLDPVDLQKLKSSAPKKGLIAFMGTDWVSEAVSILSTHFDQVLQCVGDGTKRELELLNGEQIEVLEEDGIADVRFALFSSLALSLHQNPSQSGKVLQQAANDIQQQGMWENPSSLFACCLFGLDVDDFFTQVSLVGARQSWEPWLKWAGQTWEGITSYVINYGGMGRRIDGRCTQMIIGNELGMNNLVASNSSLICLFEEQIPNIENANDLDVEIWACSQKLVENFITFTQSHQLPVCVFQVPKWTPQEALHMSMLWVHSALILNALRGIDPLDMWGADQWRLVGSTN